MSALQPTDSAARRLHLLQDLAQRLNAELSPRQILAGVACCLRDAFGWDYVGCALVDADADLVRYEAHAHAYPHEFRLGLSRPLDRGLVGAVARSGEPRRIDDLRTASDALPLLTDAASAIAVPVTHQGDTIAVLDLQSRQPAAFGHEDAVTLGLVAELLGGTLAASQRIEAARQHAEVIAMLADASRSMLAEDRLDAMMQRLADELQRCFQLSLCTLCLVVADGELVMQASAGYSRHPLVKGAPWRPDNGVIGRALRTGKRMHVPDVDADPDYIEGNPDSRAELVVPIRDRERLLGLINLESPNPASFSPSNQRAIQALADQVAGAIRLALTMQRLEDTTAAAERATAAVESSRQRLERANRRLREMSLRDPLTGLGNRRRLDRALREAWADARRRQQPLAVLLLDIDHYKAYNDHYGHAAGDACLRRIGRTLRQCAASREAVAARYGGEEFALVLATADAESAQETARRVQDALAAIAIPHAASPTAAQVTVSIGLAWEVPHPLRLPDDLLLRADRALYAAKARGRNRIVMA